MKCPKCGSEDTEVDIGPTTAYLSFGLSEWTCNNCAYHGRMLEKVPPEMDSMDESEITHEPMATGEQLKELLIVVSPLLLVILGAILAKIL